MSTAKKTTKLPGIAVIAEPTPDDYRRSIVIQVYNARELLSLAERQVDGNPDPNPDVALIQLNDAIACMQSAMSMLSEANGHLDSVRAERLMHRTVHAARAAIGHVQHYADLLDNAQSRVEQDLFKKLGPIWRRAAETAKKEAHRSLDMLCEAWPDSYSTEDI